jgi:hypothetical protein
MRSDVNCSVIYWYRRLAISRLSEEMLLCALRLILGYIFFTNIMIIIRKILRMTENIGEIMLRATQTAG